MATFCQNVGTKLSDSVVTLLVTIVITVLTLFSDKIVGNIKSAVNRADLRKDSYEKLAADIANYTFCAENVVEYYDRGWTTKSSLETVVPSYNDAIISLRKQEYVTLALLYRFWGKDDANRFQEIMAEVKEIDTLFHSLNSEAEAVRDGVKKTADPTVTKPVIDTLKPLVARLKVSINNFLANLIG